MKQAALAALLAILLSWPASAVETGTFGRRLAGVELEGARGADLPDLPLRSGDPLTPHQLAQAVRELYRTGRFARVSAWIDDAGSAGVRVRFNVEKVQRILRVSFNGASALSESVLLKAADLPPGTEFSPQRVTEAAQNVARAYFRAGWRDASVRWDASDTGEDVAVDFSLSEGDPTTIVRFEFTGDVGLTDPELHAAFELHSGDRLSLDDVDSGIEALRARFRRRGFYRARVLPAKVQAADGRAVVEIPIDAGPRFHLQVRGAQTFGENELLAQLHYTGAEPLDASMQRELADRLRAFYELAGFPEARIAVRESAPPRGTSLDDDADRLPAPTLFDDPADEPPPASPARTSNARLVTFLVREGESRRVVKRRYPGLAFFKASELDERIDPVLQDAVPPELVDGRTQALLEAANVAGAPGSEAASPRRVVPGEVYASGPYRNALRQIQDLYKASGFLDARVGPAELVPGPRDTATVVIPVEEGPRTLVTEVRLEGAKAMPASQLDPLLTVKAGDPLSFSAVEEMRQAVQNHYLNAGYMYAQVEDEEEIDDAKARAKVSLRVTEGPLVRVARITLKGLAKTDPELVKAALTVKEGEPITPQARQESVRNLMRLGLFTSASVDPADPETTESVKPLIVEVREKPTFNAEVQGGASYADGPRLGGQVSWANLGGQNRTVTLGAKVNWPVFRFCLIEEPDRCSSSSLPVPLEWRLNAGLVLPQFQGAGQNPVDLHLDGVYENLLRPAYHLQKVAALTSLDGLWHRRLLGKVETNVIVQAELEGDEFERRAFVPQFETLADRRAMLLPEGRLILASIRPAFTLDARDDKLNPTSGVLFGLSLDLSKSLVAHDLTGEAFDVQLLRTLASLSGYIPLNRAHRVVMALSARAGDVFSKDGLHEQVIGTKRFFLGGTQSLRGFNEDGLYPQDYREAQHAALDRCRALVSGLGCDDASRRLASGIVDPSAGGNVMLLGRAELRFGMTDTLDGGLFLDAGNLWLYASNVDITQLRYAAGAGLRYLLPIGPAAFDVGVNLNRDDTFQEPLFRIHLSVGLF